MNLAKKILMDAIFLLYQEKDGYKYYGVKEFAKQNQGSWGYWYIDFESSIVTPIQEGFIFELLFPSVSSIRKYLITWAVRDKLSKHIPSDYHIVMETEETGRHPGAEDVINLHVTCTVKKEPNVK